MTLVSNADNARLQQWNDWKQQVNQIATADLHELAARLGINEAKGQKGDNRVYHSPHRDDKKPSLSIFHNGSQRGLVGWKDHTSGASGADAISLHQYVRGRGFKETVQELAEMYRIDALPAANNAQPIRRKSQIEYIADRVLAGDLQKAQRYLAGRGISETVIKRARRLRVLGWNNWTSKDPEKPIGTVGYGGEGLALVVRDRFNSYTVKGVDIRYETPDHNGGVKANSQGEKEGAPFVLDWKRFQKAHTVVVCESAINALSVLSCDLLGWDALALRGVETIEHLPTDIFQGKSVVIALDYDDVNKEGRRPGPEAAWKVYNHITASGAPCLMVDQLDWKINWDLNDILQAEGVDGLKKRLQQFEDCPIPGFYAGKKTYPGKARYFLPADDYKMYWRYQVAPDLTKFAREKKNEEGDYETVVEDVSGFRVADVSRVTIQSWEDTVHGTINGSGEVLFAVQAQTPQHGRKLKRVVMDDRQFTDPAAWSQIGYIYKKPEFMRLVSILSRTLDSSDRLAVNYIGLCYKRGQLAVNDAPDCYFKDILKQCPAYGHLQFNNGNKQHGRDVIAAFQDTFRQNAGSIMLVWALGAHLKAHTGFWPHMQLEAEKSSGKSTFLRHWAKATQCQVFSTQMLDTPFRIQSAVAYSGQPVAWEEISTLNPIAANAANQMLQQTYNYAYSVRAGTTPMVYSTPVLLTGEEVDMNSLIGKLTRTSITVGKQGREIPENLPPFPMRQWLEWLAKQTPQMIQQQLEHQTQRCMADSRSSSKDGNSKRIVKNFAAIRLAWRLLCDFLGLETGTGGFEIDLIREMNNFLAETEAARQPWVWIVEIIFAEIDAGKYAYPLAYDILDSKSVLLIRPKHMMQHIQHNSHLKARWDVLPIKTPRVFTKQMNAAGVILNGDDGKPLTRERTVNGKRISHMMALDLEKLEQFGLVITREIITNE